MSFIFPDLLKDSNRPVGGIAVEWFQWLTAFKNLKHNVGVLTFKGAKSYIGKDCEFDIVESFDPQKGIKKIRIFYYQIPNLLLSIHSHKADLLFQEGANAHAFYIATCGKLLGVPFVHRLASDMDVDDRIYTLISKFEARMYRLGVKMADHISCQNEYQYNAMKQKYPNKNIFISHNPFGVKGPLKRTEREYIAWIGNFRHAKNLPALAEIVSKLPQYKFKIAGGNFEKTDADAEKGLKIIKKLPNVELVGYISNSDIPDFLNKAYMLLNTSRTEGFSNTFLEAWSVGTPVISTENVNPDNLIRKYNLGAVAENYEKLPQLIDDFIESEKYTDLSENCYKYVLEYHDPEKLAKEMLIKIKREE